MFIRLDQNPINRMVTNVPKSSEVVQSSLIILSVFSFHSHVKNLDGFIECKNIKAELKVWRGQTCKRKKSTEKVINVDFFHGLVFFIQRCQYISGHDLVGTILSQSLVIWKTTGKTNAVGNCTP